LRHLQANSTTITLKGNLGEPENLEVSMT